MDVTLISMPEQRSNLNPYEPPELRPSPIPVRFRCCNCLYVVGKTAPQECPICHTHKFEDVAPLLDPKHPNYRIKRARSNIRTGVLICVFGTLFLFPMAIASVILRPTEMTNSLAAFAVVVIFILWGVLTIVAGKSAIRDAKSQLTNH